MRTARPLGIAAIIITAAVGLWAVNPFPIPMPDFQLTKPDGTTVNATQLGKSGTWLLVYTRQNCANCDRFLRVFSKAENPGLSSHMVIVVSGATPARVSQIQNGFPDLDTASWYADSPEAGVSSLEIKGMPVIFGVRDSTINWSIAGVPSGDTAKLKAILKSWVSP